MSCALCQSEAPLQDSHIIPAFVARWLKETSATGYLRSYNVPNRRAQDFETKRLLCRGCEQRFSGAEEQFARGLFRPYQEGRSRFQYGDWLLYFAVSLAWRCATTSERKELEAYPQHVAAVDQARAIWADYLLGNATSAGPYRFNLFFTPAGAQSSSPLPEELSWYFLRAVDATPVYSERRATMYVKLPAMFFWTSVVPPDPGGWRGTRIANHGTIRTRNQAMEDGPVGEFIFARAAKVGRRFDGISERQQQKINETVLANPKRVAQSKTFEAWLDTERIRADNARARR